MGRRWYALVLICRVDTRRHSASALPTDDNPGPRRDVIRDVTDATPTGPGITRVSVVISDVINQSTRPDGHADIIFGRALCGRVKPTTPRLMGIPRRRRRRAAQRLNVD